MFAPEIVDGAERPFVLGLIAFLQLGRESKARDARATKRRGQRWDPIRRALSERVEELLQPLFGGVDGEQGLSRQETPMEEVQANHR